MRTQWRSIQLAVLYQASIALLSVSVQGCNSTLLRDEGFEVYDNIDNDQTQPPPAVSAKVSN